MVMDSSLQEIRHHLHQYPEVAGQEEETSRRIIEYLEKTTPDQLLTSLGGYGIAAVYDSKKPGPCVVLRAELDALPIQEHNNMSYQSKSTQVSHACGHDGHMTILLGVAQQLPEVKSKISGKVVLLFQPAEETAQGAKKVVEDSQFTALEPTVIYALHNLPGFPLGEVIVKDGVFAMASIGVKIQIHGESSHAGHPEQGNSPLPIFQNLLRDLPQLSKQCTSEHFSLITIIHAVLGEIAFGTSPGDAVVMATLRAETDALLKELQDKVEEYCSDHIKESDFRYHIEWVEHFPTVINDPPCSQKVRTAAKQQHLPLHEVSEPFHWTEDFSYFTHKYPGAFFGLGAGEHHAPLHSSVYDFPDKLIDKGVHLFKEIIFQYSQQRKQQGGA